MNSHTNNGDVIFAFFQMDINKETIEKNYKILRLGEQVKRLGVSMHCGGRAVTQSSPQFPTKPTSKPCLHGDSSSQTTAETVMMLW